jgi:hypothetical protein
VYLISAQTAVTTHQYKSTHYFEAMAPAPKFNPPAADLPGKPQVPEWIPPPITQEKERFAELTSIDLSLLDSDDPAVVDDLVSQVKRAIREDGFLFLENYGVSLEQVRDMAEHKHTVLTYESCTDNSLLHNTCTITSVKKIGNAFFSTPRLASGPGTSTHTDSRYDPACQNHTELSTDHNYSATVDQKMVSSSSTGTSPTGKT